MTTAEPPSARALDDRPVSAVVFDLDGLLIDSEPHWRRAEIEVFGAIGLQLDEDDVRQTMGLRLADAVRHWWVRFPWTEPEPDEVRRRIAARVAHLVATEGRPMPGALEAVARCARFGIPVGICSGSSEQVMAAALGRLGIESQVAVWHSAESDPHGKPHPACYLTTAAALGVDPVECLAIEDSFNGAIAAKAARMRVVVVPEAGTRDSPRWAFCDARLDSLDGFDDQFVERLSGPSA